MPTVISLNIFSSPLIFPCLSDTSIACIFACLMVAYISLRLSSFILIHFFLFIFWHAWSPSVYHQLTYFFFCQFISTYETLSKYYFSLQLYIFQLHNFFCCFFLYEYYPCIDILYLTWYNHYAFIYFLNHSSFNSINLFIMGFIKHFVIWSFCFCFFPDKSGHLVTLIGNVCYLCST